MKLSLKNLWQFLILCTAALQTTAFSYKNREDKFVLTTNNILLKTSDLANFFGEDFTSREQWKARPHKDGIGHWSQNLTAFAIHHTAGSSISNADTIKSIQNYQMDARGWSDIGYHFLVGNDGMIFEGRELSWKGAHVKGHNEYSVAISALGCFEETECDGVKYPHTTQLTQLMLNSIGELVGFIAFKSNITHINRNNVRGHREFENTATACPGNIIINYMEDIVAIASKTLKFLKQMV